MTEGESQLPPREPLDPLAVERKQTDLPFLVAFASIVGAWIFVAIYAFTHGDVEINGGRSNHTQPNDTHPNKICWACAMNISSEINKNTTSNHGVDPTPFLDAKYIILGFTIIPVFLSLAYIILSKRSSKMVFHMSIHSDLGLMLCIICILLYNLLNGKGLTFISYLIITAIAIFIFVVAITAHILLRSYSKFACSFVHAYTTFVLYLPNSLTIPILQCILYETMTVLSAFALIYLSAVPKIESIENFDTFIRAFHFINVFGLLWILFFISVFSQMVVAGYLTTRLWTEDLKSVQKSITISRHARVIIRYHLGTVAYGSLMALALTPIHILLKLMPECCKGNCKPFLCLKFNFYRTSFERLERFVKRIDGNAYMVSSVYGTNFNKSVKDAYCDLELHHALKKHRNPGVLLLMGQLFIIGISTLATYAYCQILDVESVIQSAAITSVLASALTITWPFFILVTVAGNTLWLTFDVRHNLRQRNVYVDPSQLIASQKIDYIRGVIREAIANHPERC